jgi:PPP family 3-phenylpropionic acid transporter
MKGPLPALAALSFCYFVAMGLFNPYAPLWFQSLGFSTVLIGGISALQNFTRIFAPYAWSWFGDHSGRRVELIRLSAFGTVCASAGLLGVQQAWPVATVTALLYVANGGVVPLYEAVLAQLLRRSDAQGGGVDPQRYGRVRVWGSVGFMVSVTAFGALLDGFGITIFPALVTAVNGLMWLAA